MTTITKIFSETIKTDHKVITEELSKSILKKYKISVPRYSLVTSSRQAVKDAKRLINSSHFEHVNDIIYI